MGARNPSSAAVPGTKGRVALGLGLRKLQAWPLDLEVLEEAPLKTTRCSNRRDFVETSRDSSERSVDFCSFLQLRI